ncbi:MAG TPA: DUF1080 domain-containing protein [Chthoniobacter sp.]|jgi:hypothetical protein
MNSLSRILLLLLTLAVLRQNARAAEAGFIPLLDREHTDGWKYYGEGEVKVEDGVATTSRRGDPKPGLYWYQSRTFSDFTLKLEFNVDTMTSNSGVMVRFPDPGKDFKVASDLGYEIDIYGEKTGTIIFLPTKLRPSRVVPFKPGQWNELEVTVVGQKYSVRLNGEMINEHVGNRLLAGYVGLQTWNGQGDVHFRNVRIQDLSAAPATAGPAVAGKKETPSSQIEPLLEPSLDAILAPLEQDPQMPRIPVEKLRASLGAGVVKAPTPAEKQIYEVAIATCEALTNGMDARVEARATAIASGLLPSISNGASIEKTSPLHGRGAGGAAEAIRKKQQDERNYADGNGKAQSAFMESSAYKAWVEKARKLRENAMDLYTRLVQLEAADPAFGGGARPAPAR